MSSKGASDMRQKKVKRRFAPQPLVIPADEVTYEPEGDWPEEVREYLIAYARTGNRTGACRLIKRSTRWAYQIERQYGDALTIEENRAYKSIADRIEQTLQYRAVHEPGMPGVTSSIFLLKAADPERFGERQKIEHSGRVESNWLDLVSQPVTQETDSSTD